MGTWAPYIAPPVGHPLAGGDLAKDLIVATLFKPSPTAKKAKAAAKALIDALAGVITIHAFTKHTVQDLDEEEEGDMTVIYTSFPPYPDSMEVGCLTLNYNPMLALPSGLVTSRQ